VWPGLSLRSPPVCCTGASQTQPWPLRLTRTLFKTWTTKRQAVEFPPLRFRALSKTGRVYNKKAFVALPVKR